MSKPFPPESVLASLRKGVVIPAHPLALNSNRKLDEKRQRALTRYYCEAGAGGIAVGVHTTQFEIRKPEIGLYEPVLELAADTVGAFEAEAGCKLVRVAGIVGPTTQAVQEARTAADLAYHLGLVSLGALAGEDNARLIEHLRSIAEIIPIFGFYLQPTVGGRTLNYEFWRQAVEIENLVAIKVAPFNRYQTVDVARAVAESGRANEVSLYTGNDDNIVFDLLNQFRFGPDDEPGVRIVGGLLGQWAVWTKNAVQLLEEIHTIRKQKTGFPEQLSTLAQQITDANAAIFDARNEFAGCIPGIHEVLWRQGFLEGRWALDPNVELSPGQLAEIDRILAAYPHLNDDDFVREHLQDWLT